MAQTGLKLIFFFFVCLFADVLRQRMMVAGFVARQQSGSPVNGETPNHNNSNMPG